MKTEVVEKVMNRMADKLDPGATAGTEVGAGDQPGRISGDAGRDPVVNRSA